MLRTILKDLRSLRSDIALEAGDDSSSYQLCSDLIEEIERELQEGYYPDEETDQDE